MKPGRFENKFVGGKSGQGVFQRIINLIPPHRVFIEPFAGEGTIARLIRPAEEIILVDKVRQPGLGIPAPDRTRFILGDGISFLDGYRFKGDEFVYGDPPYLLRARAQRGRAYYENEMPDPEHVRWLRVARAINCRVMISGYHSPLYDDTLSDWNSVEFWTMTRAGTKALEVLWFNYPRPAVLHDWRFVGDDFRARCRLRRKIKRAVRDLASMPALERGAMFHALGESMNTPASTSAGSGAEGLRPAATPEMAWAAGDARRS